MNRKSKIFQPHVEAVSRLSERASEFSGDQTTPGIEQEIKEPVGYSPLPAKKGYSTPKKTADE